MSQVTSIKWLDFSLNQHYDEIHRSYTVLKGGIVEIMLRSFSSPVNKFELGKQIFPCEQGILSSDFPSDELD